MKVQIKDVMLKELPDGGVVPFDKAALPAGASPVEKGKPKRKAKVQPKAGAAKPREAKSEAIAAPSALPAAGTWKWLWTDSPTPGEGARLKKEFELGGAAVKEAVLRVTCDNGAKVFLNGELVATNPDWQKPTQAEVGKALRAGKNELLAEATNKGGRAAFVASLTLRLADGTERVILTDASWMATVPGSEDWKPARSVADFGAKPWGDVFAKSRDLNQVATTNGKAQRSRSKGAQVRLRPEVIQPADIRTLPGFKVELIHTVPRAEQGSWVGLTVDDQGR